MWVLMLVVALMPWPQRDVQPYRLPLPARYSITLGSTVLPDGRLGTGGWTRPDTGEIRLPARPAGQKVSRADVFAASHELAHALDAQSMDDPWRRRFQSIMGMPADRPWSYGTGPTPEGKLSPSEWFGDYYGAAAVRLRPNEGMGTYVDDIDARRLRQFERAMTEFSAVHPELAPLRRRAIRRTLGG